MAVPIAASDPSELMLKAEIELSCLFAVYRCDPLESIANPSGMFPVRNGDPETGLPSTPWFRGNTSIRPPFSWGCAVTYRKLPHGDAAIFIACMPIGAFVPDVCGIGVSWPVLELMAYAEISFDPEFAAY